MAKRRSLRVKVASPCPVSWESMAGDERVRFCSLCRKCVYNLSEMTFDEARGLALQREGSVCVRFFQREDGTVMTSDCEIGLMKLARRARARATKAIAAALGFLGLIAAGRFAFDALSYSESASTTGAIAAPAVEKPNPMAEHRHVTMGFPAYATES